MAIRDLIPWSRQENRLPVPISAERARHENSDPLLSLHREVNRLFDDVFHGFGVPSPGSLERGLSWPNIELAETDKEIAVTAELPGLDEEDVGITIGEGALTIRGEKKSEVQDNDRGYSERSYGRFERRIALPRGIERDGANARFKSGVLTVILPKTEAANENIRRIPVNGKAA
ncbi:Hsp20/alpha crystallin family protein [Sphingobium yanoikuyae]|uniref:Hsp20/alpha crystallin family protein n=1 Tax=Sphingobium yanoikuyae TaxID=13690 RepID=UPI0022DE3226|nr:Hsp20/alpha crystallin family protein [Sphingobium yanoikuyae]WBQ19189.1 Hsp20/alpha crystallin family protein [Sphingobium yanoikuyae]